MPLIAIVGADGAGKSTVVARIRSELSARGSVTLVDKWDILETDRFREYRFLGTDLKTLRSCVAEMQDVTRTLFLFWALHGTMTPARLLDSDVVLLDGYWPKHAAAETAYSAPTQLVESLIAVMPPPDLTILLDVDPEVAYARRAEDAAYGLVSYECGQQECTFANFQSHQSKIRERLRAWADRYNWHVVDANQDADDVFQDVLRAVRARLDVARQ